jgi:ATP synthase protein I
MTTTMTAPRPDKDGERDRDNDRGLMPVWRLSSIGIEMGVAVFVGWLIGHYLDKAFGTDPWLMVLFLLLGVAAGFKGMVAAAREATGAETPHVRRGTKSKHKEEK